MSVDRRARLGLGATALVLAGGVALVAAPPASVSAVMAATAPPGRTLNPGQPTPYPILTLAPLGAPTDLPYPAYGTPVPGVGAGSPAPDLPPTLTLEQAIAVGFARSPLLAVARGDVGVQAAQVRLQQAGLLPLVSAGASLTGDHIQPGGTGTSTSTTTGGTGTGGTGTGARDAPAPARAARRPRPAAERRRRTRRSSVPRASVSIFSS